ELESPTVDVPARSRLDAAGGRVPETEQNAGEETVERSDDRVFGRLQEVQAERRDSPDHRQHFYPANLGEGVDGTGDGRRQLAALHQPGGLEFAQPVGEQVGGDTRQGHAQVGVTAGAADELAQDQQRPALAEHVEALGDRTVLVVSPGHTTNYSRETRISI